MDLGAIGQQFGLSPQQTQAAVEALGPVIAAGMRRNASSGGGGLGDILGGMLNGGGAVDPTSTGNDILGEIFGSKEVSRGVANEVSASTGIGAAVLKKLLPILASVIMAQMASRGPAPVVAVDLAIFLARCWRRSGWRVASSSRRWRTWVMFSAAVPLAAAHRAAAQVVGWVTFSVKSCKAAAHSRSKAAAVWAISSAASSAAQASSKVVQAARRIFCWSNCRRVWVAGSREFHSRLREWRRTSGSAYSHTPHTRA